MKLGISDTNRSREPSLPVFGSVETARRYPWLLQALASMWVAVPVYAQPAPATVEAIPGQLLRWAGSGSDVTRCRMAGRSWKPLDGTCYFPIDIEHKPGVVSVGRQVGKRNETAHIRVGTRNYGTEEVNLPDIPQKNPSTSDLKRVARERVVVGKVFHRPESPARFTLPLGKPAHPFPEGKAFGVDRVFDGKPAALPHTGTDYPVPVGTPIVSVADGTVALAEDLFYAGNAVFVDHGDGLVTMYFHLSDIKVEAGSEVKKGDRLGSVGSTGRATGPHLFFGVSWRGARIDPKFLLEDPKRIPEIGAEERAPEKTSPKAKAHRQ